MTVLRNFAAATLLGAAVVAAAETGNTLQPLNDAELRGVSTPIAAPRLPPRSLSRGLFPLHGLFAGLGSGDGRAAGMGTQLFPLLGLLNADVTARDVAYGADGAALRMNADGSVNLALPATIGELDLQNIRAGVNDNSNFGAVQIRGIDLSRTVISVTPIR